METTFKRVMVSEYLGWYLPRNNFEMSYGF